MAVIDGRIKTPEELRCGWLACPLYPSRLFLHHLYVNTACVLSAQARNKWRGFIGEIRRLGDQHDGA